ncbi:phosphoglycolate phosphatase, bacterial [Agaricicola taiwanensis]|uniref:Phosphoglycolate phosphatase n=1 Tax=Agaricicola taiwanensis TaxID=591372 RepID=A0A8J2YG89_9RHOB|nr:HAD-IA family hydrolase [Agaricicola taiwanensis]GGE37480.1 phosphoglycolate phosphatase, bacterial [Agaricicola taiwanensis]
MRDVTLVFDLDGTLVDTAPDLIGALNKVLAMEGLAPVSLGDAKHLVGAGVRALVERGLREHGHCVPPERFDELMAAFLDHYVANIAFESRPFPDMVPVLESLALEGARLAVCTNKLERLARMVLDQLELSPHFAAIGGGDTFGASKPDPRHLLGTIERAGGDAKRAVMIGDSLTDLRAGREAAIPVVLVDFGYTDVPAAELGADAVIGSYRELRPALKQLGFG